MRTAERARIAVVGLGRIGRLHASNLAERVAHAELAGVADVIEPRAREVAARHGVQWAISPAELMERTAPDGVAIAAPSGLHPELVRTAADAGAQVFCEKPVGLAPAACREAVAAADAAGVTIQAGFQRRFDRDWLALRAAGRDGTLGALDLFRCSHRNAGLPPSPSGLGDVFTDVAVHDLDAARWLAGEPVELYAAAGHDGATATIALRFEGGGLGLIDVNRRAGYGFDCVAELSGTKATMRIGQAARAGTGELLRAGQVSAPLPQDHGERHRDAYIAELEHFAEVALGREEPVVSGDDALAALTLAALAARSAELGTPLRPAATVP